MRTMSMLAPKMIATAVRLALAFGVVLPALLWIASGQGGVGVSHLGDAIDPAGGIALLAFTAFLASHRLRAVDLVKDAIVLGGPIEAARRRRGS